jgi:hypothetical protein
MIIGKAISPFAIKRRNGNGGTDADAQAFITASGISGTNATAVNQLVIDLKAANIWTKMKCVYPFVGNTASTQKWNLKNPADTNAAFRLVFSGGGTFSANGYLPNGTNAYANTWFMPSINATASNLSAGVYLRTNNITASYQFGGLSNAGEGVALAVKYTDNNTYFAANNYILNGVGNYVTDTRGFFIVNKFGATTTKIYKNGLTIATATPTTINVAQAAFIFIGARSVIPSTVDGYDNKENAFSFIGNTLTDAEALALYNAVQTFNTTLARQV